MTKRDKLMILALVLLFVVLLVKSFVFDPYQAQNDDEALYMKEVENILDDRYSGGLYGTLIHVRVVKISEMSESEKSYKDLDGNVQTTNGKYKAKIRKYILGVLPYSEESILQGVSK